MSEMITVRDADMIAAEINEVKRQVQEVAIYASIKIGGKLTEAKSLVNHGEWGKWLEENVEYSQSTANYLMQLYQEYGSNQASLFDNWTNSQTFAKLGYSQHIALLALPFGERQEFAEQNQVEKMSTRELKEAIRERDAARNELKDAEDKLSDAYGAIKEIKREREKDRQDAEQEMKLVRADLEKEKSKVAAAETKEKEMLAHLNKLQKDVQEAQAAEQAAVEDLKKATENPEVPESVMEKLRKEAAAEAAKEARAALQKKLEAAEKKAGEAEQARVAAEERLAEVQKGSKLADPDVAKFLAYNFGVTPDHYVGYYEIRADYDKDGNGSYSGAEVKAAIDSMRGLTTKEKSVLWQLATGSKSTKNNPYDKQWGQKVIDARNKE